METASNNNTRPEVTSLRKLKKKKKKGAMEVFIHMGLGLSACSFCSLYSYGSKFIFPVLGRVNFPSEGDQPTFNPALNYSHKNAVFRSRPGKGTEKITAAIYVQVLC